MKLWSHFVSFISELIWWENFLNIISLLGYTINSKRYISNSTKPKITKLGRVSLRGLEACTHQVTCSFDHVMSRNKIKTLYLHFLKNYKYQTWHSDDLGWLAPTYQVLCSFVLVVVWYFVTISLYLYFHNTYTYQTWYSGDVGSGAPTY